MKLTKQQQCYNDYFKHNRKVRTLHNKTFGGNLPLNTTFYSGYNHNSNGKKTATKLQKKLISAFGYKLLVFQRRKKSLGSTIYNMYLLKNDIVYYWINQAGFGATLSDEYAEDDSTWMDVDGKIRDCPDDLSDIDFENTFTEEFLFQQSVLHDLDLLKFQEMYKTRQVLNSCKFTNFTSFYQEMIKHETK